jgi:hypothetical protein
MDTQSIIIAIASFLGGSLITIIGFVTGFTNRIARIETKLDAVIKKSEGPIVQCSYHITMSERLSKVEEALDFIKGIKP